MTLKFISWNDFSSGILTGLTVLTFSIASISLIMPGSLMEYLPLSVFCVLIGGVIGGGFIALKSVSPLPISYTITPVAALMGGMLAEVAKQIPASHAYPTLFVCILFITLVVGVTTYLIGTFGLAHFVGYVPYPVFGGFILGTAWIMLDNIFSLLSNINYGINPLTLPIIRLVAQYFPGILFGTLLFSLSKYFKNTFFIPLMIAIASISVHGFFKLAGISYHQALSNGWFFSALSFSSAWASWQVYTLSDIHWVVILKESSYLFSIILIIIFLQTFGLNTLEVVTKKRIDIDKQLKTTGTANIINGFCGGAVTVFGLSNSIMNYKLGAETKISGVIVSLLCGVVLFFSQYILIYIPKIIISGLLIHQSLNLFEEWLIKSWKKLPLLDYLTLIAILIVVIFKGLVFGVVVGTIIASFLFIYDYSRTSITKYILSGETQQSHHKYSAQKERLLYEKRKQLFVFKLQGYIFFGSAKKLLNALGSLIFQNDKNKPRFIILDFQQVTGIDSSAGYNFIKIKHLLDSNNIQLIFSHLSSDMTQLLEAFELNDQGTLIKNFPTLDLAIECCESKFLEENIINEPSTEENFDVFGHFFSSKKNLRLFSNYLTTLELPKGKILFHQGDTSDSLFFIASGKVTAYLELPDKSKLRIYTSESGTIIGEMGFFTQNERSATVIVDETSVICKLTRDAFKKLLQESFVVGLEFCEEIIRILSERLSHADKELALLNLNLSKF